MSVCGCARCLFKWVLGNGEEHGISADHAGRLFEALSEGVKQVRNGVGDDGRWAPISARSSFYFAEEVWKRACTIAAPVPAIGLVDSASVPNSLAEIPTKSALLEQI
jgi:hypothetical protein